MEKCRRPLPFLSFSSPGVDDGADAALPGAGPVVFRRLAEPPGAAGGVAAAPDPRFAADAGGDAGGDADSDACTCGKRKRRIERKGTEHVRFGSGTGTGQTSRRAVVYGASRGGAEKTRRFGFARAVEEGFISQLDHRWIRLGRGKISVVKPSARGRRAPSPFVRGSAGPPRPRRTPRSYPPDRRRRPCYVGKARWSPPSRPAPVSPQRNLNRCHLSPPRPRRTALRIETNREGDEGAVSGASGNASGCGPSVRGPGGT